MQVLCMGLWGSPRYAATWHAAWISTSVGNEVGIDVGCLCLAGFSIRFAGVPPKKGGGGRGEG